MRHWGRAFLLLAFSACAFAAHAEPARPARALGLELGYLSVPISTADPYSFAASAGLWCERALGPASPLSLGAWLAASGFRPLDAGFGDSFMYYGGLEVSYRITLLRDEDSAVSLRPLARLGWYSRSVEIQGETEWGSRPFAGVGCLVDLRLGDIDTGLALLVSVPMDNSPVLLVGVMQRIGLCL
jgi:hypothetical protein